MIIIMFEIQQATKTHHKVAKVWVNSNHHEPAEALAIKQLIADGYEINTVIENTITHKDDYFPPCTSLDAFLRAERDGIAILYS